MAINGKPRKIEYETWSKPELIKEIKKLEKRKKYGIVWDEEKTKEIFEEEVQHKLPVLTEIKSNEMRSNPKQSFSILIEGDNYHALSVLNYTHKSLVDVIYIDPPYNTGNKTWKYNNRFVEKDDSYKHSKWLSFMYKRLKLAKNLLKHDGFIVVSIDDYELHPLGLLMDEIFGEENRLATIIVESNPSGRTSDNFFATAHEYYLVYAKHPEEAMVEYFDLTEDQKEDYKYNDDESAYKWRDFLRTGGYSTPEERPNSFYPIFYNQKTNEISIEQNRESVEILPIDSSGKKRVWRQTKPSLLKLIAKGDIMIGKGRGEKYRVMIKDRIKEGMMPKTVWTGARYSASTYGTKLLEKILAKPRTFEFPKSVNAIHDILFILTKNKPYAIILDFFAGSGTTGHATLELNKEDDGNRKFILCTNNENDICTEVCYPRIKKVMEGYKSKGLQKDMLFEQKITYSQLAHCDKLINVINDIKLQKQSQFDKFETKIENGSLILYGIKKTNDLVKGLDGNLKYFKTEFISWEPTDKNKRDLVQKSTEMLCLKEYCFDLVKEGEQFKIFKNHEDRYIGIIYYYDGIELFKKEVSKLNKKINTYVFSFSDIVDDEEFQEVSQLVNLKPIPASILNIYKRIFGYVQTKKLPREVHSGTNG